jgi:hypothetical protein
MTALDGNAAGGVLLDVYGVEMTTVTGTCATCGNVAPIAEVVAYLQAPGTVLRCRRCGAVLLVVVERAGIKCVDSSGVRLAL